MEESPLLVSVLQPDAAVDGERGAGDVVGVVGGEEHGGLADVLGHAEPAPGQGCAGLAITSSPNASCSPGVSIQPGSITLTLIRCGYSSAAIVKAMLFRPALPAL